MAEPIPYIPETVLAELDPIKVGRANPRVQDDFSLSFIDRVSGFGHRLMHFRSSTDNPETLEADLVLFDEIADCTPPVPVIVPAEALVEEKPFTLFLKEHESAIKQAGAAVTAVAGVVALSTLVVFHKRSSKS